MSMFLRLKIPFYYGNHYLKDIFYFTWSTWFRFCETQAWENWHGWIGKIPEFSPADRLRGYEVYHYSVPLIEPFGFKLQPELQLVINQNLEGINISWWRNVKCFTSFSIWVAIVNRQQYKCSFTSKMNQHIYSKIDCHLFITSKVQTQ